MEHVEVLQRKFDEFQKDMASQEYRVTEVNELADKLVLDGHPERDVILKRKEVSVKIFKFWVPLSTTVNFRLSVELNGMGTTSAKWPQIPVLGLRNLNTC